MKKENGITLVALVISIIVLLILAGVTIATLTGDNGLLTKSKFAVDKYSEGEIEEQIKLTYTEWQTAKITGTTENANNFIKNRLNSSIGNVEDVSADDNALTVTINKNGEDKTYYYNVNKGTIKQIILAKNSAEKNDSYVGCYADIDEDGVVDGIIFGDLLTGIVRETQSWGTYTLPVEVTVNNVNKYYITQKSYTDSHFGTHPVISPLGNGKERFYIMTLTDFTTPAYIDELDETKNYPEYKEYYYYKNAYENKMDPSVTSTDFGTGKTNTKRMIDIWNADGGEGGFNGARQDNQDIWKHIQTKYEDGWFIPSKGEWAIFAKEIGDDEPITTENFRNKYGLRSEYLTSSQYTNDGTWRVYFNNCSMYYGSVRTLYGVRLATTF